MVGCPPLGHSARHDGDGQSDTFEEIAGTDPDDPTDFSRVETIHLEGDDLVISFEARADRRYELFQSDTVGNFTSTGEILEPAAGYLEWTISDLATLPKEFYQLRVSRR